MIKGNTLLIYSLLMQLTNNGKKTITISVKDISKKLNCHQVTVCRNIQTLEQLGYIRIYRTIGYENKYEILN